MYGRCNTASFRLSNLSLSHAQAVPDVPETASE